MHIPCQNTDVSSLAMGTYKQALGTLGGTKIG